MSSQPIDPLDQMEALVDSSADLIEQTYQDAVSNYDEPPVIFVVDCEDELGQQVVTGWIGEEAVDEAVAEQRWERSSSDSTTVFARAEPFSLCQQEIPSYFPYLAESFRTAPPRDQILVVAISAGGAGTFSLPITSK